MAKRFLMIEGDEKHLSLVEKILSEKGAGVLGYNIVDIGYNYDEEGGWSFTRFKLRGFVKAITIEWIEKWAEKFYKEINGRTYYIGEGYDTVWDMLEDWEKEHEVNRR